MILAWLLNGLECIHPMDPRPHFSLPSQPAFFSSHHVEFILESDLSEFKDHGDDRIIFRS